MLRKKILTILGLLTLSIIFLNSIKNLQFNNDKWLLNENPYQKTINYINSEFEPGTKLTIVVHHDKKFFNETTINEFSKLS